jgi:hypothetical protein
MEKRLFKFRTVYLYLFSVLYTAALHARQLEELRDSYLRDQNALLLEASREEQEIKSRAKYNEEHLKTINFQMLHDMETWNSVWKENHTLKTDEIRNNVGGTSCMRLEICCC